jgi:hypothetical protein
MVWVRFWAMPAMPSGRTGRMSWRMSWILTIKELRVEHGLTV